MANSFRQSHPERNELGWFVAETVFYGVGTLVWPLWHTLLLPPSHPPFIYYSLYVVIANMKALSLPLQYLQLEVFFTMLRSSTPKDYRCMWILSYVRTPSILLLVHYSSLSHMNIHVIPPIEHAIFARWVFQWVLLGVNFPEKTREALSPQDALFMYLTRRHY